MTERGILMSGPMAQAAHEGRKTQTRRVIRPQPFWIDVVTKLPVKPHSPKNIDGYLPHRCPYGEPGDLLYVRETWAINSCFDDQSPSRVGDVYEGILIWHCAADTTHGAENDACRGRWRPSIYMPKWAARTWLRLLDVWIERVQEISTEDIECEGILHWIENNGNHGGRRRTFAKLWDSLNAKRGFGWDANQWVWVLKFKRTGRERNA